MESKKYNKLVHITKKKQIYRCREQTTGYQGVGRDTGVANGVIQATEYKTGYKDTLYNIENLANILQ